MQFNSIYIYIKNADAYIADLTELDSEAKKAKLGAITLLYKLS